jgi:hypothetical protein
MSVPSKRVREQAVVYLADRDRTLLDELVHETGLSRTELFRRGLWALAAQLRRQTRVSALETLIGSAGAATGPSDLSERADDYLYGGGYAALAQGDNRTSAVAESGEQPKRPRRKGGTGRGARSH